MGGIARTFRSWAVGKWDAEEYDRPIVRGNCGSNGKLHSREVLFTVNLDYLNDRSTAWLPQHSDPDRL